jgi:hypothetical protein
LSIASCTRSGLTPATRCIAPGSRPYHQVFPAGADVGVRQEVLRLGGVAVAAFDGPRERGVTRGDGADGADEHMLARDELSELSIPEHRRLAPRNNFVGHLRDEEQPAVAVGIAEQRRPGVAARRVRRRDGRALEDLVGACHDHGVTLHHGGLGA